VAERIESGVVMTLSMYEASVPVFVHGLDNLAAVLRKGAAHAQAQNLDPASLLQMRLAPDMHPLIKQVQIAADLAKGPAARLAGVERPSFDDIEASFEDLYARIEKTIAYLQTLDLAEINASEERVVELNLQGHEVKFRGQPYLLYFALPNFYFHLTTAYAILRHAGVPLGKRDYVGALKM